MGPSWRRADFMSADRRARFEITALPHLRRVHYAALHLSRRPDEAPDLVPEVERALDGLPELYRDAVLLVDVQELTYEEAAAVLDCPIGTVRSRLFRARKLLFVALYDYARQAGYLKEPPAR